MRFQKEPNWEILLAWVVRWALIFCALQLVACGQGHVETNGGDGQGQVSESLAGCTVSTLRYPTSEQDFSHLYSGRGFLTDGVHIGRDILLAEGTPIYPIACGTIRVYRAAQGYGTLVVVIEHHLASPITVRDGGGGQTTFQDFLTIYGHLRKTPQVNSGASLTWREGDTVRIDQPIGYVQNAALNGDGGVHLHFGVRLQSAGAAAATDPTAWFAGYDPAGTRRRWYADPASMMSLLMNHSIQVATSNWHPAGAVLRLNGQTYLTVSDGVLSPLAPDVLTSERLDQHVITGAPAELGCDATGALTFDRTNTHHVVRFDGSSTVYEYVDTPQQLRYSFLAQQAFDSWGWTASSIEVRAATARDAFLARYRDVGGRRLRDGTLVKASGRSDVYVVSQGTRRPIIDWPTFLALGYDSSWIIEVDSSVLDVLAGPLGSVIGPQEAAHCLANDPSVAHPPPLMDAGVMQVDAGVIVDAGSTPMDAGVVARDAGVASPMDAGMRSVMDAGTPLTDASLPLPAGTPVGATMRYEFRLANDSESWSPTEPYLLRDQYWSPQRCLNTSGSDLFRMTSVGAGWYRCDTADVLAIFVGTFFSPGHLSQGDRGNIATIDNWPMRCTPRNGIEWRITDLSSGRSLYQGPASGLPCVGVDSQDRHHLP